MRSFRKKLLRFAVFDILSFRVQIGANFLKTRVDISLLCGVFPYDDSPLPNRRLHKPENKEYLPLQATKLKNKMHDRLALFNIHMNTSDQQKK